MFKGLRSSSVKDREETQEHREPHRDHRPEVGQRGGLERPGGALELGRVRFARKERGRDAQFGLERPDHGADVGITGFRTIAEHPPDDDCQARRDGAVGSLAADQRVERPTETGDVLADETGCGGLGRQGRRQAGDRDRHGGRTLRRLGRQSDAEIGQPHQAGGIDLDLGQREVAVIDPLLVGLLERPGDLEDRRDPR